MEMETESINYEPPSKIVKIDVQQYPSLYVKLHLTGLFDIQQAQSVIYSEPSMQRDATPLLFRQMAFNLTFVAITEDEYIMINKSIREILDWEPHKIPYLQLFVKKLFITTRYTKSLKHDTCFVCGTTTMLHWNTHSRKQKE